MKVGVYCAASDKVEQKYKDVAYNLGKLIAQKGHVLIYGGGNSGLMGEVARGAEENKGHVLGVVPDFMSNFEPIFSGKANILHTKTMAARKEIMEHISDCIIILPGGIGTFDEFFQILTQKELNRENDSLILFDQDGFYDDLLNFMHMCADKHFIQSFVFDLFKVVNSLEEIEAML